MTDLIPIHMRHLRVSGYAARTRQSRQWILTRVNGDLAGGLDDATPDAIEEWFDRELAAWSRSTYWSHLQGFYSWGVRAGHYADNPMTQLRRPRYGQCTPRPVTDAQLATILDCPREPERTIALLAAYAGLRVSEIGAMQRERITEEWITVIAGKGGRDATVPTHPRIWAHVRDRAPGPLIVTARGYRLTGPAISQRQRPYFRSLGLPDDVHWHSLRHWYCTALFRGGTDARTVQELSRHARLASLQGYALVVDAQRQRAVLTLPSEIGPAVTRPDLVPAP